MKHISVTEFRRVLDAEKNNSAYDFINVCTAAEYAAAHIDGVRSVPLSELTGRINEFEDKKVIYVQCHAGGRSAIAIHMLDALGIRAELINVDGGLVAWHCAGFQTVSSGAV